MPVSLCRFAYLINLTTVQILPLYNVLAVKCIISNRSLGYSILMAKTQGFYKVVRASAVTHRKLQISKVVTPPIPD
jgi:hypothetical protein